MSKASSSFPQSFILPNEFANDNYSCLLENSKGVLISVGTFRTLFNAVMGNFSHVIMFDFDENICNFNAVNLDLIRAISLTKHTVELQRFIYLCILCNVYISIEVLQSVSNSTLKPEQELEQELEQEKLTTVFCLILDVIKKDSDGKSNKLDNFARYFSTSDEKCLNTKTLTTVSRTLAEFSIIQQEFMNQQETLVRISRFHIDGKREMTPWSTDSSWEKLTSMIQSEQIQVVKSDLCQPFPQSMLTMLTERGLQVSILDISNSQDYFLYSLEKISAFQKNVDSLFKTVDMRILFTLVTERVEYDEEKKEQKKEQKVDNWTYSFSSPRLFLKLLRQTNTQGNTSRKLIGDKNYFSKCLLIDSCLYQYSKP
jgi:hypothetical protein